MRSASICESTVSLQIVRCSSTKSVTRDLSSVSMEGLYNTSIVMYDLPDQRLQIIPSPEMTLHLFQNNVKDTATNTLQTLVSEMFPSLLALPDQFQFSCIWNVVGELASDRAVSCA